jgi:LL-diaminopimelate aminotransferase
MLVIHALCIATASMTLDWISPATRVRNLPQYVFARLDELKVNARKQGIDLIDLGMGNPDGAAHESVIAAAKKA